MAHIYEARGVDADDIHDFNEPGQNVEQHLYDWETNLTQLDLKAFNTQREKIQTDLQEQNPLKNHLFTMTPESIPGVDHSAYHIHPAFFGDEPLDLPEEDDLLNIEANLTSPNTTGSPTTSSSTSKRLTDEQFHTMINNFLALESSSFVTKSAIPNLNDSSTMSTDNKAEVSIDNPAMAKLDVLKRSTRVYSVFDSYDDPLSILPNDDPIVRQHKFVTEQLVLDTRSHWEELKRIQQQKEEEILDEENQFYREVNRKNTSARDHNSVELQQYDKLTKYQQDLVIGGKYNLLSPIEVEALEVDQRIEYEKLRRKYLQERLLERYPDLNAKSTTPQSSTLTSIAKKDELENKLDALSQDELDQLFDEFSFDDNQLAYLNSIKRMLRLNFNKIFQPGYDTRKYDLSKPIMSHIQYDLYQWISEKLQTYRHGLFAQQRQLNGLLFDIRHGLLVVDSYGTLAQMHQDKKMSLVIDDDPELAAEYQRLREKQEIKIMEMRQRKNQSIAAQSGQTAPMSLEEKQMYDQKEHIYKLLSTGNDIDSILSNQQYSTIMGDEISATLPKEAVIEFAKTHLRLMQQNKAMYKEQHIDQATLDHLDTLPIDGDDHTTAELKEQYGMNIHPGPDSMTTVPRAVRGVKFRLKKQSMDDIDTDDDSSLHQDSSVNNNDSNDSHDELSSDSDSSLDEYAFQRSRYTGAGKSPRSGLIPRKLSHNDSQDTDSLLSEEKSQKLQDFQDKLDAELQQEFYQEDLQPLLKPYENYSSLPEDEIIQRRETFLDQELSNFKPSLQQLVFTFQNDHEIETFVDMLDADMFEVENDWVLRPWVRKKYDIHSKGDDDDDEEQPELSFGDSDQEDDNDNKKQFPDDDVNQNGNCSASSDDASSQDENFAKLTQLLKDAIMPPPRGLPDFVASNGYIDPEETEMDAMYLKRREEREENDQITQTTQELITLTQALLPTYMFPSLPPSPSLFNPQFDDLDSMFDSCMDSLFSNPIYPTRDEWITSLPVASRLQFLPEPPIPLSAEELKPALDHHLEECKQHPFYNIAIEVDERGLINNSLKSTQNFVAVRLPEEVNLATPSMHDDEEVVDETDTQAISILPPGVHKTKSSGFVLKLASQITEDELGRVITEYATPDFEQVFDSLIEKTQQNKELQLLRQLSLQQQKPRPTHTSSGLPILYANNDPAGDQNLDLIAQSESILHSVLTEEERAAFIASSKSHKSIEHNESIEKSKALEKAFNKDPTNVNISTLNASASTATNDPDTVGKFQQQFSKDNLTKLTSAMNDNQTAHATSHLSTLEQKTTAQSSSHLDLERGPEYDPTLPSFYAEFTPVAEALQVPLQVEVNEEYQQSYKEAYENNLLPKRFLNSTLFPEPVDYHVQMDLIEQNGLVSNIEEYRQQLFSKFHSFEHARRLGDNNNAHLPWNPQVDGKFAPLKANGEPMSLREEFEYKLQLDIAYRRENGREALTEQDLEDIIHQLDLSDEDVGVLIGNQLNNTSSALTARIYAQQTNKAESMIQNYRQKRDLSFTATQPEVSSSAFLDPEMVE